MRDDFCDWDVKCAKYLTFNTLERADNSTLSDNNKAAKNAKT